MTQIESIDQYTHWLGRMGTAPQPLFIQDSVA
jgi:hypothetical protein